MKSTNFVVIGALLIIAALVVCIPASAHMYVPQYTSKYIDPNAGDAGNGGGFVYVSTLDGNNIVNSPLIVYRADTNMSFTNTHTVDKGFVDNLVKFGQIDMNQNETLDLNLDGRDGGHLFVPGDFLFELVNGDRGNPEFAMVHVTDGNIYTVQFLGHAVSFGGKKTNTPVKIVSVTYGEYFTVSGHNTGSEVLTTQAIAATNHPGSYTITASVGSVLFNGVDIASAGDPAVGSVKVVTVVLSNGQTIKIAENDENSYFATYGNGLADLPMTATITL